MRFLPWLLTSALLAASTAFAETPQPTPAQLLKEGLTAMRSGEKALAWDRLYPLAQAGDIQSMYYLGEMMLRSPEYGDHIQRAIKFFTVAAAKGHKGAEAMLPQVKNMLANTVEFAVPTIAGASGLPTKEEIAEVHAKLSQHTKEVLRFTDNTIESIHIPRIEVMVFTTEPDASTESLYRMTQSLERQFGTKIKTRFFVVIQPDKWQQPTAPTGGVKLSPNGFTPDFKGQLATQYGVRSLPAVVVLPPSGQAKVISDLSSLTSHISSLL